MTHRRWQPVYVAEPQLNGGDDPDRGGDPEDNPNDDPPGKGDGLTDEPAPDDASEPDPASRAHQRVLTGGRSV